jgi:hypothetical protein
MDRFNILLQEVQWGNVQREQNTQNAYTNLHDNFMTVFQRSFPYKQIKKSYSNKIPWLTQGIKRAIQVKNQLYTKQLKHPNPFNTSNL